MPAKETPQNHKSTSSPPQHPSTTKQTQKPSASNGDLLIRLAQQTLQAQQHGPDVQASAPPVLEDVEADAAREVDVWVVDGRLEQHRGRRVWVCRGEGEGELERQACVGRFGGPADGCGPGEEVVGVREGADAGRGRHHEGHELGLETVVGVLC